MYLLNFDTALDTEQQDNPDAHTRLRRELSPNPTLSHYTAQRGSLYCFLDYLCRFKGRRGLFSMIIRSFLLFQ